MERTIAAISTPQGNGGIAVIRISGNDAVKVADKVCRLRYTYRSLRFYKKRKG